MYNEKTFPSEIHQHDIELLPGAPTELVSKPFRLSGIRLEQLRDCINEMVNRGLLIKAILHIVHPYFL